MGSNPHDLRSMDLRTLEGASGSLTKGYEPVVTGSAVVKVSLRLVHINTYRQNLSPIFLRYLTTSCGAIGPHCVNVGIEDGHRHAHVRRMRGNAVFADSQHGVSAVEAVERITAGSGLSAVARRVNIIKKYLSFRPMPRTASRGHSAFPKWSPTCRGRRMS